MTFFGRLAERVASTDSIVCVGLDPRTDTASSAHDECLRLVEATADVAAAFKPNSAFFERFGAEGVAVLVDVVGAVPDGVPVILDAKRGDIGSTAEAYASAVFETIGADAVTLSPYLGADSIDPFLAYEQSGVFVLCRTSNPGASMQQLVLAGGDVLFEDVVRSFSGLGSDRVGFVVGATVPKAVGRVRVLAPDHWILAPGVGAQGGDLEATVTAGLRADGLGLLLPVSRAVAEADDPRGLVEELNERVRGVYPPSPSSLRSSGTSPTRGEEPAGDYSPLVGESAAPGSPLVGGTAGFPAGKEGLAALLFDTGCVRFGEFTLKSGAVSPVYLDLRTLVGHPTALRQVAAEYVVSLPPEGGVPEERRDEGEGGQSTLRVAGVPLAGLPIATAVALVAGIPMVYPRPPKDHGTGATVEGPFETGDRVVIVDDVATSGISVREAAAVLRGAGLVVEDAVVLVDRGGGAREALASERITLHAVMTLAEIVDALEGAGKIAGPDADAVRTFLAG